VAGPLRAANGFHVLKLLGTKSDSKAITTAEAKQIIFRRKFEEEMQSWIQQIRDGAYIKTMLS